MLEPGGGPTTGLSEAYLLGSRRKPSDQGRCTLAIGAVLLNLDTYARIDISDHKADAGTLRRQVPKGNRKIMAIRR